MPIEADVSALVLTTGGRLFIGTRAGLVQRVK
jgi:ligand-binding sensor domain-containing protein